MKDLVFGFILVLLLFCMAKRFSLFYYLIVLTGYCSISVLRIQTKICNNCCKIEFKYNLIRTLNSKKNKNYIFALLLQINNRNKNAHASCARGLEFKSQTGHS